MHVTHLAAGLEHLKAGPPDAILLDLGLPDSQGLGTLETITSQTARVPIVVLTGLNDTEMAVKAMQAGAQDYLVKGEFAGDFLTRILRYAIERKPKTYWRLLKDAPTSSSRMPPTALF